MTQGKALGLTEAASVSKARCFFLPVNSNYAYSSRYELGGSGGELASGVANGEVSHTFKPFSFVQGEMCKEKSIVGRVFFMKT